jgi:hypothetical protein
MFLLLGQRKSIENDGASHFRLKSEDPFGVAVNRNFVGIHCFI